ncbi:hypothetical protein GCM10011282_09480 [Undibacterium macrobrachii]|uniref:Transposase n=1 Tax=Undibacterium macrobrachii TaxID=1119058 RepID=A0ABQ2X9T8_9BURK|nr:hypothetical protein GCM10011282_09480 [Undibacterium macrobrachii]
MAFRLVVRFVEVCNYKVRDYRSGLDYGDHNQAKITKQKLAVLTIINWRNDEKIINGSRFDRNQRTGCVCE